FHWIVEQNKLIKNRWGIFLEHADFVDLSYNEFSENSNDKLHTSNVANLTTRGNVAGDHKSPIASLAGPTRGVVGEKLVLDASASKDPDDKKLEFAWLVDGGISATTPRFEQAFAKPGFYRLGLTVSNGHLSDLAWRDLYIVENISEIGTDKSTDGWSWNDPGSKVKFEIDDRIKLLGESSLLAKVSPYSGGRVTLVHKLPKDGVSLAGKKQLVFWLQTR